MVNIKVDEQTLPKRLKELENLKKKSYSNMELRNKNQMMSRLKRMQQQTFNRDIDSERARLQGNFLAFDLLDEEEKAAHPFSGILKVPKRKKVRDNMGGFWNF